MHIINYSVVAMMAACNAPNLVVEATLTTKKEKKIIRQKNWKKIWAAIRTQKNPSKVSF